MAVRQAVVAAVEVLRERVVGARSRKVLMKSSGFRKFSMETGLDWEHLGSLSYQHPPCSPIPAMWVRVVGAHQ